jgi:hypothetical protein
MNFRRSIPTTKRKPEPEPTKIWFTAAAAHLCIFIAEPQKIVK